MRTMLFWMFLSLLAATGGCGKKGPLYLPDDKAQAEAANKDAARKNAGGTNASPAGAPAAQPTPANPPR